MPIYPFQRPNPGDATIREQQNEEIGTAAPQGPLRRFRRFVIHWIKISWVDILGMILLAIAMNLVYHAPLATIRNFPITFTQSGDIVYPELAYPYRGWTIPSSISGLIAALVPTAVIVLAQIRIRSIWDMNNAIMGVLYSIILSTLFQVTIKMLIGGFRPTFLAICQPDISRARTNNLTGLNGVGFHQIMYTVDVCTNPDKSMLKTAMTSFPSGHSTVAFAGFGFLFLWMNAKLKVWSNYRTSFWWLALLFVPLELAVLQASILSVEQAHNWYDILAGAVIGTMMAFASYRVMYASIFDWRYNHIPLRRSRTFDYPAEIGPEDMERHLFLKKHGWGRRRKSRRRVLGFGRRVTPPPPRTERTDCRYGREDDLADAINVEDEQSRTTKTREGSEGPHHVTLPGDQMV